MSLVFERIIGEDLNVGTGTTTITSPSGGSLAGTQIGIHTFGTGQASTTASWTPGTVAAGGQVTTTVSVPGAALGDFVMVSLDVSVSGLLLHADVTASGVVTVTLANLSGAPIAVGAATIKVLTFASR